MSKKRLVVAAGLLILATLTIMANADTVSHDGHTASSDIDLRVSVANMTDIPVPGKTEVWLRGEGSWFPDLEYGGDVTTFEDRQLSSTDSLFFYPLGRGGPEMMVPIEIDSELCPQGCVRDMVNFEVWEERFVAWGSPIDGHEIEMTR